MRAVGAARQSTPSPATRIPCSTRLPYVQRFYSSKTASGSPPYLQKLKSSLKDAMRAKDQARLSVLRAIMSANLNASKTPRPIETDIQLVGMLVNMRRTTSQNIAEARKVGREDIAETESVQGGILDEFIDGSGLEVLREEQLRPLILEQIEASVQGGKKDKALLGDVIKNIKESTESKVVDNSVLGPLVKDLVNEHTKQS